MSTGLTQYLPPAKTHQPSQFHCPTAPVHQKAVGGSPGLSYSRLSNKPGFDNQHQRHTPWYSLLRMTQESTKSSWFSCRPTRKTGELKSRAGGGCATSSPMAKATVRQPWSLETDWPECRIPQPVFALFIYLAQQGVHVNDLFRRPGNINQMKLILQQFATGQTINWTDYNVYTVANVAKKVLLAIPGGLLGPGGEKKLLATATFASVADAEAAGEHVYRLDPNAPPVGRLTATRDERSRSPSVWPYKPFLVPVPATHPACSEYDDPCHAVPDVSWPRGSVQQLNQLSEVAERRIAVFQRILDGLPPSHKQLAILVFGILHQMVFHAASTAERSGLGFRDSQTNSPAVGAPGTESSEPRVPLLTIAEGVVKSVAGTLFHTCSASVLSVEQTAQVLRSLVLCFPALGESVIRFYVNAVHGHLRFSPLIGTGMTMEKATCALCPKSAHSTYFGPHDSPNDSRSCPFGLIQAASRLFCLTASPDPSSGSPIHQQHQTSAALPTSQRSARFRCPPFFSKSHEPHQTDGDRTKPGPVVVLATRTPSPVASLRSCELIASQHSVAVSAATEALSSIQQPTDPCCTDVIRDPTDAVHPPVKVQIDAPTDTKHVITLRRHQSRYRSLRRRQMENLSRRAEWFLGPTTIPTVTITPIRAQPDTWSHSYVIQSASDVHLSPKSTQPGIELTSTMSLLELGVNPMDQELLDQSEQHCRLTVREVLTVPPRLLFTASTGELEQGECSEPFCSEAPHSSVAHHSAVVSRPRHLSVGSCLSPFPAPSFVSIHSAPSADLARAMVRTDEATYFRCASHPPAPPPPLLSSSSSNPTAVRTRVDPGTDLAVYDSVEKTPPVTSLQRPLLVGRSWHETDYCCYLSPSFPYPQVPNVASCSALGVVQCDTNWSSPAATHPSVNICGTKDNTERQAHRRRRNSATVTTRSPQPATVTTQMAETAHWSNSQTG